MDRWNRAAHRITHQAGSKHAFGVVMLGTLGWAAVGLLAGPSRAWELAVTCGVPILTLLMVIVLQHAQNRDTKVLQLKLDELLLALEQPNEQIIRAGDLGDQELADLHDEYAERSNGRP